VNAVHERNFVLREKLIDAGVERAVAEQVVERLETPWRTHGVIVQCVFFFLTCIGILAFYGLCSVLDVPGEGIVVGIASIAIAEYLIRARRWFGTGVEGALWIGGLVAMITELPSSGKPEALLVFAAAAAIAGARVRNPIFGAAAAILVVVYAEEKGDAGVIVSIVMATVAMVGLLRTWTRPSTEWLWIALTLALPVAGRFTADEEWRTVTIALYALFGALALTLAFVKRHHALFFACAIGFTIAGIDLGQMIAAPLEAKLAAAGVSLLALSYLVARVLRDRTTGIVVTPAKLTQADEALEIAGALAAAHATRTEPGPETRPRGEGGFGGAGATGEF
jgi:hypothetical protein